MLKSFRNFYQNGIQVDLVLNESSRSVINFSSSTISSMQNFVRRLKPTVFKVIQYLKGQDRPMLLKFSLSFSHKSNQLNDVLLNDLDVDNMINYLEFNTSDIDGGYFEIEIVEPNSTTNNNNVMQPPHGLWDAGYVSDYGYETDYGSD